MKVELHKDKLKVSFPYDPILVAALGRIEGRKFSDKDKCWFVPLIQTVPTVELLGRFGFHFDEKVVEVYKKHKQFTKKVDRIRAGQFKQSERDILDSLGLPMYHYQEIGAGFGCVVESGLLGDQPGLGKTIQSLAMTKIKDAQKVLIFCPMSMKKSWQEEIDKWLPGSTSTIVGGTPKQRDEQWSSNVKYYICNYHLLQRDLKYMKLIDWDFVIGDEATVISNPQSMTAKNIKKIKAKFKIALTGTPLSNKAEDVWSIMDWVQPGLLGTYWQFIDEYCMKDKFGSINGYKNLFKLRDKISPYMLRRLKKDVLTELPPKLHENVWVEFSPEEHKLYEAIKEETIEELKEAGMFDRKNLSQALVKIVRLKQMTGTSELINGENQSSKLNALKELLRVVLSGDDKTIIFTSFREMALILMRELAEYKPLLIAGGVSSEDRDANRAMFNEDEEHRILIMTSAGSMGLNLQRASSVVHYDLPWSIAMTEQREDRAHRHGQKKNVTVYRMMVQNTIDEYILKVLYKKKEVSDAVLGDEVEAVDEARKVGLTQKDLWSILS